MKKPYFFSHVGAGSTPCKIVIEELVDGRASVSVLAVNGHPSTALQSMYEQRTPEQDARIQYQATLELERIGVIPPRGKF